MRCLGMRDLRVRHLSVRYPNVRVRVCSVREGVRVGVWVCGICQSGCVVSECEVFGCAGWDVR